jgi:hypothetical protein
MLAIVSSLFYVHQVRLTFLVGGVRAGGGNAGVQLGDGGLVGAKAVPAIA